MAEIENRISAEINSLETDKLVLLSEIEINLPEKDSQMIIDKIVETINNESFDNAAKKFSISKSPIKRVVVTDSIEPIQSTKNSTKINIISVSPLLSEAIKRISAEKSVSVLF